MGKYLSIIVFGFSLVAEVAASKKPNVLFIAVDDLRDCNNPQKKTPIEELQKTLPNCKINHDAK